MRLLFDHGTLVLAEAPDLILDFVPGLLWDDRVALFRAPAWRYPDVLESLTRRGLPFRDEVRAPPTATQATGPWRAVELRPYQTAAAFSWELSDRRGLVVLPTGSGIAPHRSRLLARGRIPSQLPAVDALFNVEPQGTLTRDAVADAIAAALLEQVATT